MAPAKREQALSRERIIDAAIALLDTEGEDGLTFRALATRLATGAGAIYWHVANKGELLVAASHAVIGHALDGVAASATPHEAIRRIAIGVFEAIDAHPWVGAQMSRAPGQPPMLDIFERLGRQLQALDLPEPAQFTAASTLLSYIVGVSIQNARNGRLFDPPVDRDAHLEQLAQRWRALDAHAYPFARAIATQLPGHDDLGEFVAGVDLILSGIEASR
ncbi:MAG TPA: TetR family transcriptional regulator [Kofleriaceae bacterium]|nr:TetR family transcriptional regulator [Kofleriaceae bacterium]